MVRVSQSRARIPRIVQQRDRSGCHSVTPAPAWVAEAGAGVLGWAYPQPSFAANAGAASSSVPLATVAAARTRRRQCLDEDLAWRGRDTVHLQEREASISWGDGTARPVSPSRNPCSRTEVVAWS
jgi:hypothetical protein